jgi:lactose/L-arabinose transport system substrate-binding protein
MGGFIMKRKLLSLLLAATMIMSLAACGKSGADSADSKKTSSDDKKTTSQSSDEKKEASKTPEEGSNTLTIWCWDETFNVFAMNEAAKFYQKENPDAKINVVTTAWEDIQTAITTAATSGDYSTLPDILLCQDNAFQKNVISYPDLFVDLTKSGIDFTQFAVGKTAYSVIDGKNYGLPFDNGAVIGCYRTDILEQAGYKISDLTDITWDQFQKIGEDVLAKTGYSLDSTESGEPDLILMMLQSAGSSLFDDQGKPTIANNDALKKVITTYASLAKSGVLALTDDSWDEYIKTFNSGKTAGAINGCWIMGSIQAAKDQSGKWAITNMPKLTDVNGATNYSNNGGSSWAVTTNCKNQELAADFLNKTFAGSVDFYADILPSSGAIATWTKAATADVYGKPSEFFGGDTVFTKIVDYASKVPSNNTGVYYYEARDAIGVAVTNVMNGADIDSELKTAQSTVESYIQ